MAQNEAKNSTSVALLEDKEATEHIINHVELSRSQYKLGVSQVNLSIRPVFLLGCLTVYGYLVSAMPLMPCIAFQIQSSFEDFIIIL